MSFFPIRCPDCGKVLANLYNRWERCVSEDRSAEAKVAFFEEHRLSKDCCRKEFLTYLDVDLEIALNLGPPELMPQRRPRWILAR